MTRKTVAAVAVVAAALTLAGTPARAAGRTAAESGPCPLTRGPDETVRAFSKRLIRCAATRWDVPGGANRAVCIARHESGLRPKAESSGGDYLGLFQHSARYWPVRYTDWTWAGWHLKDNALSGRTNAIVTIRMVHGIGGWRAAGWNVPTCWT